MIGTCFLVLQFRRNFLRKEKCYFSLKQFVPFACQFTQHRYTKCVILTEMLRDFLSTLANCKSTNTTVCVRSLQRPFFFTCSLCLSPLLLLKIGYLQLGFFKILFFVWNIVSNSNYLVKKNFHLSFKYSIKFTA